MRIFNSYSQGHVLTYKYRLLKMLLLLLEEALIFPWFISQVLYWKTCEFTLKAAHQPAQRSAKGPSHNMTASVAPSAPHRSWTQCLAQMVACCFEMLRRNLLPFSQLQGLIFFPQCCNVDFLKFWVLIIQGKVMLCSSLLPQPLFCRGGG